jgi:4-aminobutyrate--pyruvate transaminase
MIAEPVQAGAGVLVPPAGYFPKIQAVLDRYGILMLDDEVVCGFGRKGRWFGCESVGMKPDMMLMAKGLSSAHFPISAVAISPRVYEAVQRFNQKGDNFGHGFTNSGHPVGAAIVSETIVVYKEMGLLDRVAVLGAALERAIREAVADSPIVGDIRTRGLLAGVELADRASKASFPPALKVFDQAARAKRLMVRLQGETISFCPPFILTDEQVVETGQAFAAALRETERQVAAAKAA